MSTLMLALMAPDVPVWVAAALGFVAGMVCILLAVYFDEHNKRR